MGARGVPACSAARKRRGALVSTSMRGRCSTCAPAPSNRSAYARGLARAALAAGALVHTRGKSGPLGRASGRRLRLKTDSRAIAADWIVVATDAYAERGHGGRRGSGSRSACPISTSRRGRSRQSSRPRYCPAARAAGTLASHEFVPFRSGWTAAIRQHRRAALRGPRGPPPWALRALKKTFPQIGEVEFEAQWYGMMGMTSNALPRFHRLAENVVSFSGYNGRGIGTGTVFGRLLADHVLGKLSEKDLPLPVPSGSPGAACFERGVLRGWSTNRARDWGTAMSALASCGKC